MCRARLHRAVTVSSGSTEKRAGRALFTCMQFSKDYCTSGLSDAGSEPMLEILRHGGGLASYSKENRIEARDAARCDQMPAMQRRGSGDLDLDEPGELVGKRKGGPGPWGVHGHGHGHGVDGPTGVPGNGGTVGCPSSM
jgi:hypothetical protein